MTFLGKWTLSQGDVTLLADLTTGALNVGPAPTDGSDRVNAYGTATAFTLQAANGSYVVRSGIGYAATAVPPAAPNWFALVTVGSSYQVVDLGPDPANPGTNVWSVSGGVLSAAAPANPAAAATLFVQNVVTPGLADILSSGFTSSVPDLTWVSVPNVDWSAASANVDLTKSVLLHTDFSGGTFAPNTPFHSATADHANFSNATLNDCDLSGMTLTWTLFVNAKMDGVDFSYSNLDNATCTGALMRNSTNLANATFDVAKLDRADLSGAGNIYQTSFKRSSLVGVSFKGSSVTGWMDLTGADLTGAYLSNPPGSTDIYPKNLRFDSSTRFYGTVMQYLDLTGYDLSNTNFARADLTGCKLDSTNLATANLGYAILDGVSVTGGVSLHGANLTSASLNDADLTGAQLGAVGQSFRVGAQPNFAAFQTALRNGDGAGVAAVFQKEGRPLTAPVAVLPSTFTPDSAWTVSAANVPVPLLIVLEGTGASASLAVYQPTSPAVLSNAFMVNVDLNGANLYGVRASGAQIYATAGKSVNLNRAKIDGLQVNNANLSEVNLSQANVSGVNFDYAMLTGADFSGATIGVDASGGQTSFNGANLQGVNFSSASLKNVILANAACAVANPNDANASAGVWLFTMPARGADLVTGQLQAALTTATAPIELLPTILTSGPVPKGLTVALTDAGLKVAPDALVVVTTTGSYWNIIDDANAYVVFESVTDEWVPSLGVASGGSYTVDADCYLDLSLEAQLANGPVAPAVAAALKTQNISLSPKATITIAQYPKVWQVVSGRDVWTLWLRFNSTALGVDTQIAMRPAIGNLISAFGSESIALSAQSVVTAIASGGWLVDNDSENPFNAARGYITYSLLPSARGGIDVYGSWMRIVRTTGQGAQQFYNVPCAVTQLTSKLLAGSGNTVCPNGGTVSANTSADVPFDQWLQARLLPSPPFCIPDPQGNFNCPK